MNYTEVYVTGKGDVRSGTSGKKNMSDQLPSGIKNDGIIRVRRESKGKGGKVVTAIYGIPLTGPDLKTFLKKLKQKLGTGGQIKNGVAFIQGDKASDLCSTLKDMGYKVKQAGA